MYMISNSWVGKFHHLSRCNIVYSFKKLLWFVLILIPLACQSTSPSTLKGETDSEAEGTLSSSVINPSMEMDEESLEIEEYTIAVQEDNPINDSMDEEVLTDRTVDQQHSSITDSTEDLLHTDISTSDRIAVSVVTLPEEDEQSIQESEPHIEDIDNVEEIFPTVLQQHFQEPITLLIDPGHGGRDSGAVSGGITEKYLNGQISHYLGEYLSQMGVKVLFTRNPLDMDTTMGLQERVDIIEREKPDLVISIHHNANPNSSPRGYSLFWSSYRPWMDQQGIFVKRGGRLYPWIREEIRNNVTYVYYQDGERIREATGDNAYSVEDHSPVDVAMESELLADYLHQQMEQLDYIDPQQMGGRTAPIVDMENRVLRLNRNIAVLVECGFMTNQQELRQLNIQENQRNMARAISKGIMEYLIQSNGN